MAKKEYTPEELMERNLRRQMQRHGAKIRERIKADKELLEAQQRDEARRYMMAMEMHSNHKDEINDFARGLYLCNAIKSVTTVVARSFNIDQPINYRYETGFTMRTPWLTAYTNLLSMELRIDPRKVEDVGNDDEKVRRVVAVIKGATYHEVAHCLWTKHMIADYFSDDANRRKYHRAWNLLEDGRIESLLITKSPVIKKYLLPMMWDIVVAINDEDEPHRRLGSAVPFLLVRPYIPRGMQRQAIHSAKKHVSKLQPCYSQDIAGLINDMLSASKGYNACTNITDQIPFIMQFHELMTRWSYMFGGDNLATDTVGSENAQTGNPNVVEGVENPSEWDGWEITEESEESEESDTPINADPNTPSDSDSDPTAENGKDVDGGDNRRESDDNQPQKSSDSKDDNISADHSKASDHGDESDGIYNELNESVENAVSDYELKAIMQEWNSILSTGLRKYDGFIAPHDAVVKQGDQVRAGMINALDTVVMTASPSWKYRMDNGSVLDVDAFTNRELGDDSYWMAKDDSGERGHDLAISVLLDCSGSMSHNLSSLGACAYGIHGASQALGIPCTTSIFGSVGYLLWDSDTAPIATVLPDLGGTHVRECLQALPLQREGKSRHIVFILTDGDWEYEVPSLQPYIEDGMYIVLIGLNLSVQRLQFKQPTRAINIKSVMDLPKQVELVIGDFFR